jgi:hypothetical protein
MNRAFTLTLKRPHESLGIPMPIGRKLSEAGKWSWFAFVAAGILACGIVYVWQVNRAATKGFELRALEVRKEKLEETVASLEDDAARRQTMKALETRVQQMGYVTVDRLEYVDVKTGGYAMAK